MVAKIPQVINNQVIDTAWGNAVANAANRAAGVGTEVERQASGPVAGSRWFSTDKRREWLYDGSGWIIMSEAWRLFTPTGQAGFTIGGGSLFTRFRRRGGECDVAIQFTLGTTSAMGTDPRFNVPFQAWDLTTIGGTPVMLHDDNGANGGRYQGGLYAPTADQGDNDIHFGALNASGTYTTLLAITNAIPFTWAVNDYFATRFTYEMSSIYTTGDGGA